MLSLGFPYSGYSLAPRGRVIKSGLRTRSVRRDAGRPILHVLVLLRAASTAVTQFSMLVKALVVALVVCAACAQLEQGILAAQYYPRPSPHPRQGHITFSTQPPRYPGPRPADFGLRLAPRAPRSYFDRDAALAEGNDAALRRALPRMADPRWTPDVRSRAPWLT